jgi:hypothetical protein
MLVELSKELGEEFEKRSPGEVKIIYWQCPGGTD